MDLTALQTRCKTRFRDTGCAIYNDAAWLAYLNDAYGDVIAASPHWPFLETVSCTGITVAANARTATMPTDASRVMAVRNATDKIVMEPYEGHEEHLIDDPQQALAGIPRSYRVFGSTIQVYPLPTATTTLHLEYKAPPALLASGSDEPAFPEQFHRILVEGALSRAYEDDGQLDQAGSASSRFDSILHAMMFDQLTSRQGRNRQIVDTWYDRL